MNKGLEKLFIESYDENANDIFRYCYFKIGDREIAKDMLQDVFAKTWGYLRKGNIIENFRPFLYRTANNIVIDWYRKKKSFSLDLMAEQDGFDPVDLNARTDEYAEVEQAMKILAKLDKSDQDIIILRYVNDMSPKDIAMMLNEKENNISVRLHRAITKLRNLID